MPAKHFTVFLETIDMMAFLPMSLISRTYVTAILLCNQSLHCSSCQLYLHHLQWL